MADLHAARCPRPHAARWATARAFAQLRHSRAAAPCRRLYPLLAPRGRSAGATRVRRPTDDDGAAVAGYGVYARPGARSERAADAPDHSVYWATDGAQV